MALKLVRSVFFSVLAIGGLSSLDATPMLRLVSATVGPISIAPGANGINQTVEAYNAGDGTLSLILSSSSSSASWLTPFVGAPRACTTTTAATSCIPLTFALNTASLAASATPYTGVITVMAPNAVDAPQTITVTVLIGGAVPPSVNVYVPPNTTIADANSVDVSFSLGAASCPNLNGCLTGQTTTQDGANWLRLTLSGAGSFQTTLPYTIVITPQATNTAGNTYTGTLVTSGSSFGPDNKTIPVTMNVTTLPIAQPSVTQVTPTVQLAPGAPALPQYIVLSNLGQGALAIGGVTASGSGITATFSGSLVTVTLDPTGLSPNIYTGSVSIASNAANSPTIIPVTFQAVAAGAPTIFYQGVVDDAVFGGSGFTVTPGDVIALFGQELSFQQPVIGPMPPLQYVLGGSSVSVNGEAAPLYYSSYGQINFQIPVDIPTGTALVQVANEPNPLLPLALAGNTVSVNVAARAPRLLLLYGTGGYGAIEDASQGYSLPFPSSISIPAFVTQPASPGDVLTIFAIGLGATSPAVATGQPAPAVEPLARLTVTPSVVFTTKLAGPNVQTIVPPSSVAYAGLSPTYAGLYQINVAIPQNCPLGTVEVSLTFPDSSSNPVNIQVE